MKLKKILICFILFTFVLLLVSNIVDYSTNIAVCNKMLNSSDIEVVNSVYLYSRNLYIINVVFEAIILVCAISFTTFYIVFLIKASSPRFFCVLTFGFELSFFYILRAFIVQLYCISNNYANGNLFNCVTLSVCLLAVTSLFICYAITENRRNKHNPQVDDII